MSYITDAFCTALQAVPEAVRQSLTDPADQIRLLATLAVFQPVLVLGDSPITSELNTFAEITAALCRRSALTALGTAVANYVPVSSDDAADVLALVVPLYDAELTYAGDVEDDDAFAAMQSLRTAVVRYLSAKEAQLPSIQNVTVPGNMPSFVIAWRLYKDPARALELTQRNNPAHPMCMPVVLEALSR